MDNTQQYKSINKGRPVYFSYARNSFRKPGWEHISDCVTQIIEIFGELNIEYRIDVRNIGSGDNISNFEREIGWNSEVVILVISDKYFRSLHCMYEFLQIKQALKQHPEKRLICIKSGNVDINNPQYLLELEHYLGTLKQEYETIEYHQLRRHSDTEEAAYKNGFYINEIRTLPSFFNKYTFYNADTNDWRPMLGTISNYYTTTKKSFLMRMQERKASMTKLKWFALGSAFLIIMIFSILTLYFHYAYEYTNYTYYPECEENCYVHDNEIFTNITKLEYNPKITTLYFHSVNLTDDTLRRIEYDTVNARIQDGLDNEFNLLEIGGLNNQKLPEYYQGGKGAFVDYYMKFPSGNGKIDFMTNNPLHNIIAIIERYNHLNNESFFVECLYSEYDFIEIDHPEYTHGIKNLYVNKIDINSDGKTILMFHLVNPSDKDTALFYNNDCRIVANGDTLFCYSANGIKTFPYKSIAYKKTAMNFALFFPAIDFKNIDSIDFVINDTTKITGLKLRKHIYASVEKPEITGYNIGGANITKVEIDSNATVIHFIYSNNFKNQPIYTRASNKVYIQADGKKYPIKNASGIAFGSGTTMIPPNTSLDYALIFPPIPPETKTINYINTEFSREQTGEQRFRALIYLLGSECANETGDTISTGSFGIRLK